MQHDITKVRYNEKERERESIVLETNNKSLAATFLKSFICVTIIFEWAALGRDSTM